MPVDPPVLPGPSMLQGGDSHIPLEPETVPHLSQRRLGLVCADAWGGEAGVAI